MLRQPPIDAFQQIPELGGRNRHRHVRAVARNSRRPNEASALQSLRIKAQALAIVPQHLDQATTSTAEHKQVAIVWITLEDFLDEHCQPIEPLPHIGIAGREPAAHRPTRGSSWPSIAQRRRHCAQHSRVDRPVIRIRAPAANSTSIVPQVPEGAANGRRSGATDTAANRTPSSCCIFGSSP